MQYNEKTKEFIKDKLNTYEKDSKTVLLPNITTYYGLVTFLLYLGRFHRRERNKELFRGNSRAIRKLNKQARRNYIERTKAMKLFWQ